MENNLRINFFTSQDQLRKRLYITFSVVLFILNLVLIYKKSEEYFPISEQYWTDYFMIIAIFGACIVYFMQGAIYLPQKKQYYIEIMDHEIILKLHHDTAIRIHVNEISDIQYGIANTSIHTHDGNMHLIKMSGLAQETIQELKHRLEKFSLSV